MRHLFPALFVLAAACGGAQTPTDAETETASAPLAEATEGTSSGCPGQATADTIPDIDCPMHPSNRGGEAPPHAHGHHRPFDDMGAYAEFLERPERDAWQQPDVLIAALAPAADDVVVDIGAGSGYFAFRFADQVSRVDALDIEPEMVAFMEARAAEGGVTNVFPTLTDPALPDFTEDATLVFVCDVFHHVEAPEAWLAHVAEQLQPGDRLVFVEFLEGELPVGPPVTMRVGRDTLTTMATDAGLTLTAFDDALLPYQYVATYQLAP